MTAFIKKYIFAGKTKTATAVQVFLILCFYAAFTTVYAYLITAADLKLKHTLLRLGLGILIVVIFVVFERVRINTELAAFLSPSLIVSVIYFCGLYFGDVLVFTVRL